MYFIYWWMVLVADWLIDEYGYMVVEVGCFVGYVDPFVFSVVFKWVWGVNFCEFWRSAVRA